MRVWLVLGCLALLGGCVDDADGPAADPSPDAAALDAAPADSTPPDAADAEPPAPDRALDAAVPDSCPAACERIVDCALGACGDLSADDAPALRQTCLDRCAELASIGPVVAGLSRCDEVVQFTEQTMPEVLGPCVFDPAFPPRTELCATYGTRLAECMVETCPPAADVQETLAAGFTVECDAAVAMGADPGQIAPIADAPCDAWTQPVAGRVEGDLAGFCARGPLDTPEDCAAACDVAAECLNPDAENNQPFRNPERCAMLCLASDQAPPGWACLAEEGTCDAIQPCFAPQPAPECTAEAERVLECVVARCAPAEPLSAGLQTLLVRGCEDALRRRRRTPEMVEASLNAPTCEDDPLAERVAGVIERPDDPQNALAPVCEDGPRDPELCAAACADLGPCLDEGNILRDPDVCDFYCGTTAVFDDARWQCAVDAAGCMAIVGCFTDP